LDGFWKRRLSSVETLYIAVIQELLNKSNPIVGRQAG
jgi:hypothetical protein